MGYRDRLYHLYSRRNFFFRYSFLFSRRFVLKRARKKS
jgi:hypothetical protein